MIFVGLKAFKMEECFDFCGQARFGLPEGAVRCQSAGRCGAETTVGVGRAVRGHVKWPLGEIVSPHSSPPWCTCPTIDRHSPPPFLLFWPLHLGTATLSTYVTSPLVCAHVVAKHDEERTSNAIIRHPLLWSQELAAMSRSRGRFNS